MEEDEYERTLLQLPSVHVFKIPVRKSADGHRASEWPKAPTWTGKLRVVAKGKMAAIILLDAQTNQTFAVCPVSDEAAVERTLDSGRYFVLRIQNAQGKHAFIGIAFNERNDAFDFNVALQEHKESKAREDRASKGIFDSFEATSMPTLQDLSIKEGEKITINIASGGLRREKKMTTSSSGGLLAPPPTRGALLAPPPSDRANFTSSSSAAATTNSIPAVLAPKSSGGGEWDGFSNDPFATPSGSSGSSNTGFPW